MVEAYGTLIGELPDPVTSQVIQQFVAAVRADLPGAAAADDRAHRGSLGKVVAVAADVTEATQG